MRPWRWVLDWRNGAVIVASGLLILLGVIVSDSIRSRDRAFDALKQSNAAQIDARQAATRRIDLLTDQIAQLQRSAEANGARIAELLSEISALQEQVRQLGGRPVVIEPVTTTTTTTRPASTPLAPAPATTTTTTTTRPTPSTTTTTTTAPARCLPIVGCLPGRN